jgi:HK97 family phage major capsid protein
MLTWAELATSVRGSIDTLLTERKAESDKVLAVRTACIEAENRDPSEEESAVVRSAQAQLATLDERIEDLRSQAEQFDSEAKIEEQSRAEAKAKGEENRDQQFSPVKVGAEPSVYNRGSAAQGVSLFRDLYNRQIKGSNDRTIADRLERYQGEIELRMQDRAVSTTSFAGLIPPQYLVDEYALVARNGRVFLNSLRKIQLPDEGMSLIIPRGTTGASATVQATENSSVSNTDEVWANLTVPVITIAGQQDVSRQSLERGTPGIDAIIFADLSGAYVATADVQAISGTGSSGQALGITNTAGIGQSTAYGAVLTPALFLKKLGGAINFVQTTRKLAPDVIFMHPQRWSWLITQVDSTGRPLFVPDTSGPFNAVGTFNGIEDATSGQPAGKIQGLPVFLDPNIPTTVGTNSEDIAIVCRWEDLYLWQDQDGSPTDLRFEQTLGNQLTVKLVAYGYEAFTAGRYPGAVAIVGGADSTATFGQVLPTF